ncbi:MAG: hypothetical protein POELPBGB_03295 [Bacteroidia bacterium]|nr:hypothetical protein [Bacteroidia bacterium]
MKISERTKHILIFILVNSALLIVFKAVWFLENFSGTSLSDIQEIYPRFYKVVFLIAHQTSNCIGIWFILFLFLNGLLIYLFAGFYNKKSEVVLATIVVLLLFAAAEFTLRKSGYKPGIHTYVRYFNRVDSLYIMKGFEADENGIFKVSKTAVDEIREKVKTKDSTLTKNQTLEVYSLVNEHIDLLNKKQDNEFAHNYYKLAVTDSSKLSELEKTVVGFVSSPINSDGFRSIEFKPYENKKPKILLIGDSFTWGHSATVKSGSFADILLARGYTVYNAGISGTDVAQYLAVAKKYIPLLKPDVVIVNFFLGNDITYFRREVKPFTPAFFPTNAGNLMTCPHGTYFKDMHEAYKFNLQLYEIVEDENMFNYVMSKTVITTLMWKILLKAGIVNYGSQVRNYFNENEKIKYPKPYCDNELREIKSIAEQNAARFILSSIPEVYRFTFNTKKDFPDLFDGLDYVEMEVTKEDYKLDDGHFNDFGHKRYADFLIRQIETND